MHHYFSRSYLNNGCARHLGRRQCSGANPVGATRSARPGRSLPISPIHRSADPIRFLRAGGGKSTLARLIVEKISQLFGLMQQKWIFLWIRMLGGGLISLTASAVYACNTAALDGDFAVPTQHRAATAFVDELAGTVFLSWRLLSTDSKDTSFDVYRCKGSQRPIKVNKAPLTAGTNIVDSAACDSYKSCQSYRWFITGSNGKGIIDITPPLAVSNQPGQKFTSIPTTSPGGFGRNVAFGDFNGDQQMDFTLRYSNITVDPYHKMWRPSPGTYRVVAFDHQGKELWSYDMGPSIEQGMWYSPYLVYDLDQDGHAELIVKGGDDALAREDMMDKSGRITKGPEFLKIISGKDGQTVRASAPWPDRSGFIKDSAPHSKYNFYSRNQMAIAYVDGKHPHVVVERGTYGKQKVHVYRYSPKDGLTLAWRWENVNPAPSREAGDLAKYKALDKWWGQGAHTIRVGDIDEDGKDEIILGSTALDNDGTPLWTFNRGDLDHIYLGDLNPSVPGLELYYGAERGHAEGGMGMVSARTGEVLWHAKEPTQHIHKEGLCADLYRRHPGVECYSGEANRSSHWTWSSDGKVLSKDNIGGLAPKAVYWGTGAQKGLIRKHHDRHDLLFAEIVDVESGDVLDRIYKPHTMLKRDRQYFKLLAIADIMGDWREEIIAVDRGNLVFYMSTIPTGHRQPWLMSDHIYKMSALLSSMGYYHQPLLGYDLQTALTGSAVGADINKGPAIGASGSENNNRRERTPRRDGKSSVRESKADL